MQNRNALIIKNFSLESPGLIEEVLNENSLNYEIVDLDQGENFPNPKNYSAIFVLGGSDSANDQTPKMQNELKRIKEAIDAKIPYFGVCLGMQTLIKAMGGEVYKNPIKEIGFRDPKENFFEIHLTVNGSKDKIFGGIKSPMKILHLHGETVKLNSGTRLLATGKYCKNQVVKIGKNAYGFQGHIELNSLLFEKLIVKDPDLKILNTNKLRDDYKKLKSEYENNGREILNNFLEIAIKAKQEVKT